MKKSVSFAFCSLALLAFASLQGCRGYVYTGPHHGGGWSRGPGWGHHPGHGHPGHRPGHRPGPRPGPGHRPGPRMMTEDAVEIASVETSSAALLAADYGLKLESAEKIVRLAEGADLETSLGEVGMSLTEAASLQSMEMPSDEAIAKVASHLGEDQAKIEKVLADFVADAQAADAE